MVAHTPAPGDIVRIRSARWRIASLTPYDDATVVEAVGCDRENRGERAHFLLPFEPFDGLLSRVPRVVHRRRWRRVARSAVATVSPAYDALDAAVAADFDVLPFQLEPALAVTRGLGTRLLIADEVGLGKTVQAGLVIAEVLRRRTSNARAIVVCPAGLREQWQGELRDRCRLAAQVLDAAAIAASPAAAQGANPWAAHQVVIASIDYVKRPEILRALEALVWDVVVFDEAHALSGRSDRHTAAAALADRARTVVLLTATPHSGDDDAFARLTSIGELGEGLPLLTFRRTRGDAGLALPRRTRWRHVRPTQEEARMHEALGRYTRMVWAESASAASGGRLAMAVLTRRAGSSATSLARSVERRLALLGTVEPTIQQLGLPFSTAEGDDEPTAPLAWPGLADCDTERELLQGLLALARDAARSESKLRVLTRLLTRVREPAIVFTEYRDTLAHVENALAAFAPVILHGALRPSERRQVIHQFTTGRASLLLATDAASEGLNLHQHCRLVVNLELPWTPLRLEQRIGRVERLGQRRRVHAVHLVAAGTGEETTVATLCRRIARVGGILEVMQRPGGGDSRVMQSIVEGIDQEADAAPPEPRLPPGLATPDLRHAAVAEAQRILRWRHLAGSEPPPQTDKDGVASLPPDDVGRPVVSMARRRGGEGRCWWAFRTTYVDARRRRIWETLAGIECRGVRAPHGSGAELRRWSAATWDALLMLLEHLDSGERSALESRLRPVLDLAVRREHAIAAMLDARQARMAATVIQPGLFDRRTERAAAAQAAIVDEALARCRFRLGELNDARVLMVERRDLVFALVAG